jgi:signal transduction histidine kinase
MHQTSVEPHGAVVHVLLVEDSEADSDMVRAMLSVGRGAMEVVRGLYRVSWVDRLEAALDAMVREPFDVVLLDLRLPDSPGLDTLDAVRRAAPELPVVVLTGYDDDGLALLAIQHGAQDYLAKDHLDGRLLSRTIRHAIERKRAEVQLRRHASEVESARAQIERQAEEISVRADQINRINSELDDFAYIASHDLKEPLRGIKAYCEILLEDYHEKIDEPGRKRLAKLGDLCERLENLVGDLLTYCRLGATQRADEPVDLNQVFDDVLDTLAPTIDRNGGEVVCRKRLPRVTGDATLLGMALTNLISNGLKFTDGRRSVVEVGCVPGDPPTIFVRDNGIGIAPEHHQEIFTIFRRLHPRHRYEGTGAGLTIVRKIIEAHGGRIWLESKPAEGTTFYFTVAPAKTPNDHRPVPPTTPAPHWAATAATRPAEQAR